MSELTGVERHLHAAQEMLVRGCRPTVDLLVNACGGSRTTAQKALAELWENRLPALLSAREYEDNVPVPVREAVGALWREAREQAEADALDAFREANAALDAERVEMRAVLAGIEAERTQARETLEAAQAISVQLEAELTGYAADLADTAQRLALTEKDRDAWFEGHARQEGTIADLSVRIADAERTARDAASAHAAALARMRAEAEAERDAQRLAHQHAIDALKSAYVDSEARLRVDLDAARTDAAHARRALDAAGKQQREREDALLREIAALRATRQVGVLRGAGRKIPISRRKRAT